MRSLEERFNAKWEAVTESGCWLWMGATNGVGYGTFYVRPTDGAFYVRPKCGRQRMTYAHRLSYELHKGPLPEGLTIDHLCRVRCCVNPGHLEAVTLRVNLLRGEGLPAKCAKKTHCPQGHPYDATNTHHHRNGSRQCRECGRRRDRRNYARRKAALC